VILRHSFLAKRHVALGANEIRILSLLIELEIHGAAFICRGGNVTSLGSAARPHRYFQGFRIDRVELSYVMTVQTIQIGMFAAFVTKRARRNPPAPTSQDSTLVDSHHTGQFGIEVHF